MKIFLQLLMLSKFLLFLDLSLLAQASPIAAGKSKYLGNIYSASQLPEFTQYWNQVTPENAGKWGSVEGTRNVMNWTALDAAYKLAKDNGFPFRMHVLVWGNQQPAWIESLPPQEQLEEINQWFSLLAQRYPAMEFIEVVNEPINDPPSQMGNGGGNYIGALGGTGTTQYDWIINAFRLARQHFPNSKLMINEYNILNNTNNLTKYMQIIDLLKAQNLIDAIGVQGHAFSTKNTTAATLKANLDLLAAKGLPIYITELDIDGSTDNIQLQEYKRVFPVLWEHPAVNGITLWGYRPGLWRDAQGAYLITANGTERPALTWLRDYVAGTVTGIKKVNIAGLTIGPNPVTNNRITISGLDRNSIIKVYDAKGNLVQEERIFDRGLVEVHLNFTSGIYLMHLISGEKQSVRKLVIE